MSGLPLGDLKDRVDPGISDVLQPGVLVATDYMLTVDSTMQVTIAAGTMWLLNATGLLVRTSKAAPTVLAGIPAAVNNRIDQIVVDSAGVPSRLQAATDLAGNTLTAFPQSGTGGRAAIPAGSRATWDLQVTNAGVVLANCRDRRPWARGFERTIALTNLFTSSVAVQTGDLAMRAEILQPFVELTFSGDVSNNAGPWIGYIGFGVDGNAASYRKQMVNANLYWETMTSIQKIAVAPGTHILSTMQSLDGGAFSVGAGATMKVRERPWADSNNGAVTGGQ